MEPRKLLAVYEPAWGVQRIIDPILARFHLEAEYTDDLRRVLGWIRNEEGLLLINDFLQLHPTATLGMFAAYDPSRGYTTTIEESVEEALDGERGLTDRLLNQACHHDMYGLIGMVLAGQTRLLSLETGDWLSSVIPTTQTEVTDAEHWHMIRRATGRFPVQLNREPERIALYLDELGVERR